MEFAAAEPTIDETLLTGMADTIAHRGPDDEGTWIAPGRRAGFAFRRLSIIDLSPAGHQPMSSPDGRYTMVFNGEVYNHESLRSELQDRGYSFRSRSDSESILLGFAEYGPAILERMTGMWGLAIWDEQKQELFCARDRIGIKPFYYTVQNGRLLFASEIKAILRHPAVSSAMNVAEVPNYLAFSMTGRDATLFEGIRKLRPGHSLRLTADGGIVEQRYWSPLREDSEELRISEEDAQLEIMRLLRLAVKDRMMSDVPFGVFLSGGVDSSTNVALMAELMDRPIDTFSVGFKELERYNELAHARRVAELFKANYHEILIDHHDALAVLEDLVWHEDEPNGDPVCIPLNFVSQLTRAAGTTVIQVGEGSDEQFAGYPWMLRDVRLFDGYWQLYRRIPPLMRSVMYWAARPLFEARRQYLALDYLRRASFDDELYWGGGSDMTPSHLRRLFADGNRQLLAVPSAFNRSIHHEALSIRPKADILQRIAYYELAHRLPELLLMRVDKITMAHGLEARVPFLDHRLVEFTMQLPARLKSPDFRQTKRLLKKAVESILPNDLIYRKKQGFAAPIDEWMRGPWANYSKDQILNSPLMNIGLFDRRKVELFVNAHIHGKIRAGKSIYALLNLALWHKRFIA